MTRPRSCPTEHAPPRAAAPAPAGGTVAISAAVIVLAVAAIAWPGIVAATGIDLTTLQKARVHVVVHAVGAAGAALLMLRASAGASGRERLAWRLIGAGAVLLVVGDAVWYVISVVAAAQATETRWYSTLAPGVASMAIGLLVIPGPTERTSARVRRLDVLIVAVATFTVVWARPAQAIVQQFGNSVRHVSSEQVSVFDRPSLFGLVVVLVAMIVVARCRPERASPIRTAACALVAVGAGSLVMATDPTDSSDVSALSSALPLVSVVLLIATARRLAARYQGTTPTALDASDRAASASSRHFAVRVALPEIATLLAIGAVVLRQFATESLNVTGLVLGTTVVALSIVRLGRLEYEQRQLTRSLRASAERLFRDARVDTLTGLGNRLALGEDLHEQLHRIGRTADRRGLAVFSIDVDHFKRVNDALGHHIGDAVLVEVAQRLRVVFGEQVYRVGGDEFVALRGHSDLRTAEATAAAAQLAMRRPVVAEGYDLALSTSIGLTHHDGTDHDGSHHDGSHSDGADRDGTVVDRGNSLLRQADLALYRAKELGRNRSALYAPVLQERADHHIAVQEALSRAVDEGQMDVWLQPVAALGTGDIVGAQARLRWNSPDFGLLSPREFLYDAIEGGMLKSLDELLFRSIATMLPRLVEDTGLEWISTTLSRQEIVHPGLVGLVESTVDVGRDRLRIEISEGSLVDDTARRNVDALAALGIHMTVARFGTGPSSMLDLGRSPARTIKIDPSFTAGIGRRHEDTVIVASVAGLGCDLGMELAADGIDEPFQSRMLVELGFTLGEGRLIGDAVVCADFLERGLGRRCVGELDDVARIDELAGRTRR